MEGEDFELDFGEDELVDQRPTTKQTDQAAPDQDDADGNLSDAISFGRASVEPQGTVQDSAIVQNHHSAATNLASTNTADPTNASTATQPPKPATPPTIKQTTHDETLDANGNKLPAGWVSRVSRSTDQGAIYYRHVKSNTSSWDIPTGVAVKASVSAEAPPRPVAANTKSAAVAPEPVSNRSAQEERSSENSSAPTASKKVFVHPDRLKHLAAQENGEQSTLGARPVPAASSSVSSTTTSRDIDQADARRTSVDSTRPSPLTHRKALPPQEAVLPHSAPPSRPRGSRGGARSSRGDVSAAQTTAAASSANAVPVNPRSRSTGAAAGSDTPAGGRDSTLTSSTRESSSVNNSRWAAAPQGTGPKWAVNGRREESGVASKATASPSASTGSKASLDAARVDSRWAPRSQPTSRPRSPPPRAVTKDSQQDSARASTTTEASRPRSPPPRPTAKDAPRESTRSSTTADVDRPSTAKTTKPLVSGEERDLPPHVAAAREAAKAISARRRLSKSPPLAPSPFVKQRLRERSAVDSAPRTRSRPPPPPQAQPQPRPAASASVNMWPDRARRRSLSPRPVPSRRVDPGPPLPPSRPNGGRRPSPAAPPPRGRSRSPPPPAHYDRRPVDLTRFQAAPRDEDLRDDRYASRRPRSPLGPPREAYYGNGPRPISPPPPPPPQPLRRQRSPVPLSPPPLVSRFGPGPGHGSSRGRRSPSPVRYDRRPVSPPLPPAHVQRSYPDPYRQRSLSPPPAARRAWGPGPSRGASPPPRSGLADRIQYRGNPVDDYHERGQDRARDGPRTAVAPPTSIKGSSGQPSSERKSIEVRSDQPSRSNSTSGRILDRIQPAPASVVEPPALARMGSLASRLTPASGPAGNHNNNNNTYNNNNKRGRNEGGGGREEATMYPRRESGLAGRITGGPMDDRDRRDAYYSNSNANARAHEYGYGPGHANKRRR